MKLAIITRVDSKGDLPDDLKTSLINEVSKVGGHEITVYILANSASGHYNLTDAAHLPIQIIRSEDATGPTSMNVALSHIERTRNIPNAFLVFSKEVRFTSKHIQTLILGIENDRSLLVAGFRFRHEEDTLNNDLQSNYGNKELIAYRVPWNTFAIWNYALFAKYIKKFDEITIGAHPFGDITVNVGGNPATTRHKGMEDGLAIARAASQSQDIRFKLFKETLLWKVDRTDDHRKKLARKEFVMRNFMIFRDYPVENLESIEIK